ncbi:MAG: GGDEF domain-containing protein [Lachnospiraceae bacterium]|uniref:EAL domain-containing protein n=1 Tax=Candidatus Weimeria bifida TaxID=2599074 RepID=A0A6N7J0R2_9FIRM|nr:EAL domain-containing protein [Candidatus Weimeria bifida]RRF97436.1 MAG: GGDEF domain-containing protein [Lachnospiraceae bacterium]
MGIFSDSKEKTYGSGSTASDYRKTPDISTLSDSAFDAVFQINAQDKSVQFFHYSDFFKKNGISDLTINDYDELIQTISDKLSVDDEKQTLPDQAGLSVVLSDIRRAGVFVRAFHVNTPEGKRTKSLRIYRGSSSDEFMALIIDIELIIDHDWMTDEYSSDGFTRAASNMIKSLDLSIGYSICYANIQDFKDFNDSFGDKNGDLLIFNEQHVLKDILHPLLMGRLEADHFVMLVPDDNLTEENLDRITFRTYEDNVIEYDYNIRLGIYHIHDSNENMSVMISWAKLAENKTSEEEHYTGVFDSKMREDYLKTQNLIRDLDHSIKDNELIPYYQPVVDTGTSQIVSAEALVRWNHHSRGLLAPYKFLPAFSKNGEISKITRLMVDSVLDFNLWRKSQGLKTVPCDVNLSQIDFYNPAIMNYIVERIKAIENANDYIKFEVTESSFAVLETEGINFLKELKDLGIDILLDDYGSGMSSLSTLESFDFDIIKLDMGFIHKIGTSRTSEAIIRSTIEMGHGIGASVIAEGVETKAQRDFLLDAGCDMIQGYLYYKPITQEEFAKVLGK